MEEKLLENNRGEKKCPSKKKIDFKCYPKNRCDEWKKNF